MTIQFELTAEQREIRALAHEFAREVIRPVAARYDELEEFPWAVVERAYEVGLGPVAAMPRPYGGAGVDLLTYMLVLEELHWGCAGIAMAIGATGLAMLALLGLGTEAQKRRWIGLLCEPGRPRTGAAAWTEPDGGSDLRSLRTTARRVEGGYLLNGVKQFISNGGIADVHVVFAREDPTPRAAAPMAAYVIEAGTPGLSMVRKERKLGVRASHTGQVALDDCFVPAEHRLGEPGSTAAAIGALWALDRSRSMLAAGAVGIARAAYEWALQYAQERFTYDRPIVKHQGIGFKLADMAVHIDAARLLCWRAGWMADAELHFDRAEASMAKLFASDMAMRVTVDAVQILGGYGYMRECPVEKWMRDAKLYQIWEGTSEIQRLIIADAISVTDAEPPADLRSITHG